MAEDAGAGVELLKLVEADVSSELDRGQVSGQPLKLGVLRAVPDHDEPGVRPSLSDARPGSDQGRVVLAWIGVTDGQNDRLTVSRGQATAPAIEVERLGDDLDRASRDAIPLGQPVGRVRRRGDDASGSP